jgi:hypothetical protein
VTWPDLHFDLHRGFGGLEQRAELLRVFSLPAGRDLSSCGVWHFRGPRSHHVLHLLQPYGLWRLVASLLILLRIIFTLLFLLAILYQICRSIVSGSSTIMNKIRSEVFLVIHGIVGLASC